MNKQWWNVYFWEYFRPCLGVPWENRGRTAPNSIVSLWTVSRNCCMERCALYSRGVGLLRDHFQSSRLLKITGRLSVKREHFTLEWVRGEWGYSESWGSPKGHETKLQITKEKRVCACPDCLCGNPLPWIKCFSWNHWTPRDSIQEIRLEGLHPLGLPKLLESDVWVCHSPLLYKVWAAHWGLLARLGRLVVLGSLSWLLWRGSGAQGKYSRLQLPDNELESQRQLEGKWIISPEDADIEWRNMQ